MSELKVSKELHSRIFELTLALYRVTDFFPQGEVLRKHLREKANEIFGGVSEYGYSDSLEREAVSIISKIQSMRGYLEVARRMNWVKPINVTILEREYDFLTDFFEKELEKSKLKEAIAKEELPTWQEFSGGVGGVKGEGVEVKEMQTGYFSERQKKILEHITGAGQAKISDFFSIFGSVSSKTIQRDLQDLVAKNVLKKEGEKRWTTYSYRT